MFFEWDQKFTVGIDQMDTHHKKMIDIINEFHSMADLSEDREAIGETLKKMAEYGAMHLNAEENLMDSYNYPLLAQHKKMHAYYLTQLGEYMDRFEKNDKILILELTIFLKGWLENHIIETDKKYGDFIASHMSS